MDVYYDGGGNDVIPRNALVIPLLTRFTFTRLFESLVSRDDGAMPTRERIGDDDSTVSFVESIVATTILETNE